MIGVQKYRILGGKPLEYRPRGWLRMLHEAMEVTLRYKLWWLEVGFGNDSDEPVTYLASQPNKNIDPKLTMSRALELEEVTEALKCDNFKLPRFRGKFCLCVSPYSYKKNSDISVEDFTPLTPCRVPQSTVRFSSSVLNTPLGAEWNEIGCKNSYGRCRENLLHWG
jgi:hypothetical protein